jgi:hypothetical protein
MITSLTRRIIALMAFAVSTAIPAHSPEPGTANPRGMHPVNIEFEHISRILSGGYPDSFDLWAFYRRSAPQSVHHGERACVRANFIGLDVDDAYAHDIDEPVTLRLLLSAPAPTVILHAHDANGNASPVGTLDVSTVGSQPRWYELNLERARFAGRGAAGTDIALVSLASMDPERDDLAAQFDLCDVKVERSFSTQEPAEPGHLLLRTTLDGTSAPVRVGLYDATGRSPYPSGDALEVDYFEERLRMLHLRFDPGGLMQPWPHENRYYFYSAGEYSAHIPSGPYQLVISRGPMVEPVTRSIVIKAGRSHAFDIKLQRYSDLAREPWYSGDAHIHIARPDAQADPGILKFLTAEGLNVSNLLEMANTQRRHFRQYDLGPRGRHHLGQHWIAPGIEGPRTALRGHVIALDTDGAVALGGRDFLYHEVLEQYQNQGALTGYAHLALGEFNPDIGLALDVPFGLVDFVEILQSSTLDTDVWYQHLNLGSRIKPVAGSDYPYFDQPGGVRSYVHTGGPLTAEAWFEGLHSGRTFVSSGPLMTAALGGAPMGSETKVITGGRAELSGRAWLHPAWGRLVKVEVIRCGRTLATFDQAVGGGDLISFTHAVSLDQSGWVAVRVLGSGGNIAHSAPFFITDSKQQSVCLDEAGQAIAQVKQRLERLKTLTLDPSAELEYWESEGMAELYAGQRGALLERASAAREWYEDLAKRIKPPR